MISIIAAIGKNGELGRKNNLLWNLPEDMRHFRDTTRGHTVIMGQKTFESIGHPLPNRRNIVVTRNRAFKADGVDISNSLEDTLNSLKNADEEVFVIGGGEIYRQSIEKADKLYITHVNKSFPDADTFFPKIDDNIWQKIKNKKYLNDNLNEYDLEFTEYLKK
ncbi:MAG: Dihydrofolate reductase [Candidatus Nomurabacteria bacterium GW2011_GWF2_43_8]|uniref:Dihydrofolate reductase n=3 Tax=Candidatus Nomuraibacteriota TaxID=1752729 RepID=A0A0G1FK72_9BACT|nr:MAG: Dihydrofolate reductase [Candidatus Nomurabacteria bacterium GW2011_GWA2_43_15]KKT19922.1 MAG: Dihydrofolate reductase [Candidatus Nomurabacteria bacterium GW2011_GWB1_43_7]KKT22393.1 MAG: Dihydrofolate reductase [Candidatus Nomurabacteria bacterium GW2011_GWF2_43_8]